MIREWNETTIKRFIKEGRGQGTGPDYNPWLKVGDISSKGRSTRIYGHTTNRVHHLLSDLQLYYFYFLEYDDQVIDIREQYPLLDFHELQIPIDKELSKKLFNQKTNVLQVFTVSFLVTRKGDDGKPYYQARVIKASSELEKKATIERLELIRRYFDKKQIEFLIVTEKEINKQLAKNIGWALSAYRLDDYPEMQSNLVFIKSEMINLLKDTKRTFQQVFSQIEYTFQMPPGLALIVFKHLVATRQVQMDLRQKIYLSKKLNNYKVEVIDKEGGEIVDNVGG